MKTELARLLAHAIMDSKETFFDCADIDQCRIDDGNCNDNTSCENEGSRLSTDVMMDTLVMELTVTMNATWVPTNVIMMLPVPIITEHITPDTLVMAKNVLILLNVTTNLADSTQTTSILTEHSNMNVRLVMKVMQ